MADYLRAARAYMASLDVRSVGCIHPATLALIAVGICDPNFVDVAETELNLRHNVYHCKLVFVFRQQIILASSDVTIETFASSGLPISFAARASSKLEQNVVAMLEWRIPGLGALELKVSANRWHVV